MRIVRTEVRNFRKLRSAVTLDNLGEGLTIVAGSNEDGKSTLLEAVRCALFQKHNLTGELADSLQPFNSSVRPQVTVEFEVNGQRYSIEKTFCRHPEASLKTPAGRFDGAAAEDKLQELLKFSRRVRGATTESEQGIWGLLWVTQGSAFSPLILNEGSRSSIRSAIEMQVGQVLGGSRGEHLLAAIDAEYHRHFTATGRPAGQYPQALRHAEQLSEKLKQTASELELYERELHDLERTEARLHRWETENTLSDLTRKHEEAQQARASVEELFKARQNAVYELKVAKAQLQLASDKTETRAKERQRLSEDEVALDKVVIGLATALRSLEPLRLTESEAQREREKLEESRSASDRELLEVERAAEHARTSAELVELTGRFEKADPAKCAVEQIRTTLNLLVADKKTIQRLESLEAEVNEAKARLDVIATSVEIQMTGGSTATLDGQQIVNSWSGRLTGRAELSIEGVTTIAIVPGGSTQDFRLDLEQKSRALHRALAKHGWKSIEEARQQLDRKVQLENDLKLQSVILEAQAPNGVEALRLEVARLQEQLKSSPAFHCTSDSIQDLSIRRLLLQKQLRATTDQLRSKDEELKLSSKATRAQEMVVAALESERQRLEASIAQLRQNLVQARAIEPDASLASNCAAMRRAHDEIQQTADRMAEQIRQKNPELIELNLERASQSLRQISDEIGSARSRAHDIRIALSAKGQRGFGETYELLTGQLALAEAECRRLKRRADAIMLLRSTLQTAERKAKEQYLLPVTDRIRPYLEILLPGTELTLTESMEVIGLKRKGVEEPFSSLSLGTREQIAVIVRLAFADLLHAQGQPAAVVLDDAIAYADAERLDRMLLVLRRAAQRSQILVLTCRERDYERAGAPIIRLSDCTDELATLVA